MPADFEIRGAEDFLKLSKALKDAGEGELRKELNKGIRDAVKPLLPKAADALAAGLPSHLAARGKRIKQVVIIKTGSDPGVTVAVRFGKRGNGGLGASNARLVNRSGVVRHPLFGNREHWYNTPAPGGLGWFDDTYANSARTVVPDIEKAVERVINKIVSRAR